MNLAHTYRARFTLKCWKCQPFGLTWAGTGYEYFLDILPGGIRGLWETGIPWRKRLYSICRWSPGKWDEEYIFYGC